RHEPAGQASRRESPQAAQAFHPENPPAQAPPTAGRFTGLRAVRFERPGDPGTLRIVDQQPTDPGPGQIEVLVRAFPINFSDFLAAKGLYPMMPDFPFTPGVEVSGIVRQVGAGVSRLAVGDEVIALTTPEMGGQASVVVTDENLAVHKPAGLSHEEACGLPVAFLAMNLALERAAVAPGERVLIPSATGTNGLMAVQLAQHLGAEVIATAGSPRKVEFLAGLGVADAIDHSAGDVAEQVLRRTGGRGVDVVVNTQGGDALQTGINLLAPDGRYVEIAVFGLQSSGRVDLSHLVDNQSLISLNTKKYLLAHPERRLEQLEKLVSRIEDGAIKPHVARVFTLDELPVAYAAKRDRATIGRIVVSMPEVGQTVEPEPAAAPLRRDPGGGTGNVDIAVIGLSGRFPGAPDVGSLWRNLADGTSSIGEVPASRWAADRYFDPDPARLDATYCRTGGFLDDVDRFDAAFFSMSGKEAAQTDPQQRIFLEESWRALEDAGYPSGSLDGSRCGVFVGVGPSEYLTRMNKAGIVKEAQAFWGNEASVLAARISYRLNLRGPSVAVNTACSSSLVALHLACQSIRTGESRMAIAGGVFLMLAPDYLVVASNGNMLAPDGRCKTFDDAADGFGPGEGVGAVVLKPLADAQRDGDHVYGVIKGSAVNQDGKTNGITAPSGRAQTEVELAAYEQAGISPDTIGYVEAHGTGTRLGDPIEVDALTAAFGQHTARRGFCAIGSVKTNIGHTAAAAGIAGVIKVLLALRHRQIPASLNFAEPNRHIDFADSPFYVNTVLRDWTAPAGGLRRAAVSAFGFSGTNAHVVIEEAPPRAARASTIGGPYVVPLSARTGTALSAGMRRLADWIAEGRVPTLPEVAYTLQFYRDHFAERAVFVATDLTELADRLRAGDGTVVPEGFPEAERYLAGEQVDWSRLWHGERHDRTPLPGYAFDRTRHWFTENDTVYSDDTDRGALPPGPDDGIRSLLHRLRAGEISEQEAEATMEVMLGD
ncbi:MAG: zinc-binding dehydrogenase, partial [Catenulispora sp.]|nr:zinc-binding dehydrogenase [Catenulispora sp.]